MPQVISMLEKQGYECYIAACGNGFYQRDMVEDEYYGTRKTLEGYKTGKVSKIACPTPQTAARMAVFAAEPCRGQQDCSKNRQVCRSGHSALNV